MKRTLTILAALCAICVAAEAKCPDILFIVVDDQSPFDLKC